MYLSKMIYSDKLNSKESEMSQVFLKLILTLNFIQPKHTCKRTEALMEACVHILRNSIGKQ